MVNLPPSTFYEAENTRRADGQILDSVPSRYVPRSRPHRPEHVADPVDRVVPELDVDVRPVLHVRRVKNGTPATHPLTGRELRALRKLQRESGESPFAFVSERGAPFSVSGFRRMIERAGQAAGLEIKAHPHMLRHATGYALANQGTDTRTLQAYLGHRNISNTVRYTELAAGRFKHLWKD
jgi:integrase